MPNGGSMSRLPPPNSSSGSSRISARIIALLPPIASAGGATWAAALRGVAASHGFGAGIGEEGEQLIGVDIRGGQLRRSERAVGRGMVLVLVGCHVGRRRRPPSSGAAPPRSDR